MSKKGGKGRQIDNNNNEGVGGGMKRSTVRRSCCSFLTVLLNLNKRSALEIGLFSFKR